MNAVGVGNQAGNGNYGAVVPAAAGEGGGYGRERVTEGDTEEKGRVRVGCLTAASGLAFTKQPVRRCLERRQCLPCIVDNSSRQQSKQSYGELALAATATPHFPPP